MTSRRRPVRVDGSMPGNDAREPMDAPIPSSEVSEPVSGTSSEPSTSRLSPESLADQAEVSEDEQSPSTSKTGARGYSWPPFEPGNEKALTHGIYSPRRVNPIAERFIAEVLTDPTTSYLTRARFTAALWTWATAAARVELLETWVGGMPIMESANSARGQTSPLELLRRWHATLQTQSARLGLDPLSAARLGKDVSQGRQADAAGELTRLRAAHEAAQHDTH